MFFVPNSVNQCDMTPRQFALSVVEKLQSANHQAMWAGGCVRDQLLGLQPKDFDVATSALPEQVRDLFGHHRSIAIGAAFGVITVIGPTSAGQVEVATFRRDGAYSDGRHPDAVQFTDAREDARRRDFTINGMFYDPVTEQLIDYVGGQDDLQRRRIRAIGDPHARINEDKLRMLRGVRFAASFGFELESATQNAIREHATEINLVSPERIGVEMIRMLKHPQRSEAVRLLLATDLLQHVLPPTWFQWEPWSAELTTASMPELQRLDSDEFEPAAYLLLRLLFKSWTGPLNPATCSQFLHELQHGWRLTNQQRDRLIWLTGHWQEFATADTRPWSKIQPLLVHPAKFAGMAVARAIDGATPGITFCAQRLAWPCQKLDPSPFLSGQDLIAMGIQPGPRFKSLLQIVRDRQLDGEIRSVAEAQALVLAELKHHL